MKIVITFICTLLTSCLFIKSYSQPNAGDNNPPKVSIVAPGKNSKLQWNTIVPFSIHVSDTEDGDSGYGEIPNNEVLLLIKYISDSTQAKKYLLDQSKLNRQPLLLMGASNCFACHSARTKLIGPSYLLIGQRYRNQPHAVDSLTKKIISGTAGAWGYSKMPPHPDLRIEQVKEIVGWILENSQDTDLDYLPGIEGVFKTKEKPVKDAGKGAYILTAMYTDHGPKNGQQGDTSVRQRKTAQHIVVLKNIE